MPLLDVSSPRKLQKKAPKPKKKRAAVKNRKVPRRSGSLILICSGAAAAGIIILLTIINVQCAYNQGKNEAACGLFHNIPLPNATTTAIAHATEAKTDSAYKSSTAATSSVGTKFKVPINKQHERIQQSLQQQLLDSNLTRSFHHNQKFHLQKHLLQNHFEQSKLSPTKVGNFAGIPINDTYSYIHIWKCGGTTMERQTQKEQVSVESLLEAKASFYFTFVRDPMDHFLSGWAECGQREKTLPKKQRLTTRRNHFKNNHKYDDEIREWLNHTKRIMSTQTGCMKHSFPQANYLMTTIAHPANGKDNATIIRGLYPQLVLIADLNELGGVLQHVLNLPTYDATIDTGRNSSAVRYKQSFFPKRIDWLSNATLIAICEFLALDYFLFDFKPPEACEPLFKSR